jgi:hypothetical protein
MLAHHNALTRDGFDNHGFMDSACVVDGPRSWMLHEKPIHDLGWEACASMTVHPWPTWPASRQVVGAGWPAPPKAIQDAAAPSIGSPACCMGRPSMTRGGLCSPAPAGLPCSILTHPAQSCTLQPKTDVGRTLVWLEKALHRYRHQTIMKNEGSTAHDTTCPCTSLRPPPSKTHRPSS